MQISGLMYLLQQTTAALCLLMSVGLAAGLPARSPLHLALSALMVGGLCTLAAMGPGWLSLAGVPLMLAAPAAAWPGAPRRLLPRMLLLWALMGLWLAGALRLLQPLPIPAPLLLLGACTVMVRLSSRTRHIPPAPDCAAVSIRCGSCRITLTALVDSGNLLRDPLTGLPVIVISRRAAQSLRTLPPEGSLLPGMRLVSVRTITGQSLMTVMRPDSVQVLQHGVWQPAEALLGLLPGDYEGFRALLPAALLTPCGIQPSATSTCSI